MTYNDFRASENRTIYRPHAPSTSRSRAAGVARRAGAGSRLALAGGGAVGRTQQRRAPPRDTANRVRGPIDQTLNAADLAIVLNLTGAKRWHAFAPYTGVGFGILSASPGTTDPSGFRVGSNFIMAPTLGTRIFLGRALALRLEARDYWLRYEWPLAYYQPSDSTVGAVTPVLGDDVKTRQVTHNFTFAVGLSYLFTF